MFHRVATAIRGSPNALTQTASSKMAMTAAVAIILTGHVDSEHNQTAQSA